MDKARRVLPDTVAPQEIVYSVYEIHIKPNMRYQPHPAFVPEYRLLTAADMEDIYSLGDFKKTDTRVVTAIRLRASDQTPRASAIAYTDRWGDE